MYKRLLYFAILIFTLSNCNKTPYLPYHSTAGIPHDTRMVQTEMTLMNNESDETNTLSYAVIAALDNDKVPYILIVPSQNAGIAKKDLWDYNVSYSTTIHPDKAQELISSLDLILRKWNSDSAKQEGYFFEFTNTPEQNIFPKSKNVVAKLPTVRVSFNLTEKGSVGSLIIGEGESRYTYTFEEKEEVQQFRDLLISGLDKLKQMKN